MGELKHADDCQSHIVDVRGRPDECTCGADTRPRTEGRGEGLGDAQIKHMVSRFLTWKLPENFSPDGGISFRPTINEGTPYAHTFTPSGTNVFDARQAEAMVRHMIEGLPGASNQVGAAEAEVGRYVYRRIEALMDAKPGTVEGAELTYLSEIAERVEEYGEEACAGNTLASFLSPIREPEISKPRGHDWKPSTLGHGENMCANCGITNREAAVLGELDVCTKADAILNLAPVGGRGEGWRPISEAPRDGTYILAHVAGRSDDDRWAHLARRAFVVRHEGRTSSGYDLGWSVHPGFGGCADDWFSGWQPLPPPPQEQGGMK